MGRVGGRRNQKAMWGCAEGLCCPAFQRGIYRRKTIIVETKTTKSKKKTKRERGGDTKAGKRAERISTGLLVPFNGGDTGYIPD